MSDVPDPVVDAAVDAAIAEMDAQLPAYAAALRAHLDRLDADGGVDVAAEADFDESKHPRDDKGRFAPVERKMDSASKFARLQRGDTKLPVTHLPADLQPLARARGMHMKQCYANATGLVLDAYLKNDRDYTYVEGYVQRAALPLPIQHAWLEDSEGRVIDPTLGADDDAATLTYTPALRLAPRELMRTMMQHETYGPYASGEQLADASADAWERLIPGYREKLKQLMRTRDVQSAADFDESEHPRDAQGRWVERGDAGAGRVANPARAPILQDLTHADVADGRADDRARLRAQLHSALTEPGQTNAYEHLRERFAEATAAYFSVPKQKADEEALVTRVLAHARADVAQLPLTHVTSPLAAAQAYREGLMSHVQLAQQKATLRARIDALARALPGSASVVMDNPRLLRAQQALAGLGKGTTFAADSEAGLDRFVFATLGTRPAFNYGSVAVVLDNAVLGRPGVFATRNDICFLGAPDERGGEYSPRAKAQYRAEVRTGNRDTVLDAAASEYANPKQDGTALLEVKIPTRVPRSTILGFLCSTDRAAEELRTLGVPAALVHTLPAGVHTSDNANAGYTAILRALQTGTAQPPAWPFPERLEYDARRWTPDVHERHVHAAAATSPRDDPHRSGFAQQYAEVAALLDALEHGDALDAAAEPTDAQKEAGNYKKDHVVVHGLPISIENRAGTTRTSVERDADGQPAWSQEMAHDYGYVRGTRGADKDHVDVFLSDAPESSDIAYVVNQTDERGDFDEHKLMLGFPSEDAALRAYYANYPPEHFDRVQSVRALPLPILKLWLQHGNTTLAAEFDESLHPRDAQGRFTETDGVAAWAHEHPAPDIATASAADWERYIAATTAAGVKPDLCQLVPAFGRRSLGVARADMPQFLRATFPALLAALQQRGIAVTRTDVPPASLKATQKEIDGTKVVRYMHRDPKIVDRKPLLVSKDGYVLDGHHNWAADVLLRERSTPVLRIDAPIADLLPLARELTTERRDFAASELSPAHALLAWEWGLYAEEAEHWQRERDDRGRFEPGAGDGDGAHAPHSDSSAPRAAHGLGYAGPVATASPPPKDKPVTLVFGGSFNPPHVGHVQAVLAAVEWMRKQGYNVAHVIVAPTADKLLAKKLGEKAYPLAHRVEMMRLSVQGLDLEVSGEPAREAEHEQGKLRRTQLADWAARTHPGTTVVNVTGSDGAPGHPPDAQPAAYAGDEGSNHEGYYYLVMPRGADSMSSSKVRAALARGEPVPAGAMHPDAEAYLYERLRTGDVRAEEAEHWERARNDRGEFQPGAGGDGDGAPPHGGERVVHTGLHEWPTHGGRTPTAEYRASVHASHERIRARVRANAQGPHAWIPQLRPPGQPLQFTEGHRDYLKVDSREEFERMTDALFNEGIIPPALAAGGITDPKEAQDMLELWDAINRDPDVQNTRARQRALGQTADKYSVRDANGDPVMRPNDIVPSEPLRVFTTARAQMHDALTDAALQRGAPPKEGHKPRFILLMGPGGSGKSELLVPRVKRDNPDSQPVTVNADDLKKDIWYASGMPNGFDGRFAAALHEESSQVSKQLVNKAMHDHRDILIDAVSAKTSKVRGILKAARANGYDVALYATRLSPVDAMLRSMNRSIQGDRRFVPPEIVLGEVARRPEAAYRDMVEYADYAVQVDTASHTVVHEKRRGTPVRDIAAAHVQIEGAAGMPDDEKTARDTALEAYDTLEMIGDYFAKIDPADVRRARAKSGYVCPCPVCAAARAAAQQQKP